MKKDAISKVMAHLGRQRAKKLSPAERQEIARKGGAAYWDGLSPEERSAEMKRRAAKRKKKPKPH